MVSAVAMLVTIQGEKDTNGWKAVRRWYRGTEHRSSCAHCAGATAGLIERPREGEILYVVQYCSARTLSATEGSWELCLALLHISRHDIESAPYQTVVSEDF